MKLKSAERRPGVDTAGNVMPYSKLMRSLLGARTLVRYLRRDKYVKQKADDKKDWYSMSIEERDFVLGDGWGLGFVQKSIRTRPDRNGEAGKRVGNAAASNALQLGALKGQHVFCDCEWADPPSLACQIDYLNRWAEPVVIDAGLAAGLYVSRDLRLSAEQLYRELPLFTCYWRSASNVQGVAQRGFAAAQMLECLFTGEQLIPWRDELIGTQGLRVDIDWFGYDNHGDRVQVLAA